MTVHPRLAVHREGARRAFALVLVLFLTFVLSVLAYAAARVATLDARGANAEIMSASALFAARAGVQKAVVRLAHDPEWASSPITQTIGLGADAVTFTVTSVYYSSVNWWKITSVGTAGGVTHTVDAWLGPLSFAEFAYFTDSERSPSGGVVNFITADQLTGKVHTNSYFSVIGHPRFTKRVTSANIVNPAASPTPQYDPFYNPTTRVYRQGTTSTTNRSKFYHYNSSYANDSMQALGGAPSFSFQGACAPYDLQGHVDTSGIDAESDIRIPPVGTFSSDPLQNNINSDVTVVFNSAGSVTISYPAGTSPGGVAYPAFSQTYPLTTHTIYVGTVPGTVSPLVLPKKVIVHGTVRGKVTLATNQAMDIDANLVQADKTVDTLGLVCTGSDYVSGTTIHRSAIMATTSSSVAANLEIDATMIAPNGSFMVQNYNVGIPRGTLTVYGGIIQKNRGPVGTSSGGVVATGYAKNYVYDAKLLKAPPPNYPITGKVYVKSFSDRGALK